MSSSVIKITNLTKDFSFGIRGVKLHALEHLNLQVHENEVFGLLGPNGSGKSTTIKLILGLLRPTQGQCEIFGQDSRNPYSHSKVGFLPEDPYFYRFLSGREFIKLCAKICGVKKSKRNQKIDCVIDLVGMKEAAKRRISTYSKGMLKRIGLAQALVHDPSLLILDEPTAGLDPIGTAEIADIIRGLKKRGKTIFLCSHLLSQVENLCDRIAILHRGKLILQGSVNTLLEDTQYKCLVLKNFTQDFIEPAKTFCENHGVHLVKVDDFRHRLDEIFISKVKGQDNFSKK
jgi:ABC-2 type transport system ATP-binding protein